MLPGFESRTDGFDAQYAERNLRRSHRTRPKESAGLLRLQGDVLAPVAIDNPTAQEALYDADLTAVTPDGETFVVQDEFTREEFVSIEMTASTFFWNSSES